MTRGWQHLNVGNVPQLLELAEEVQRTNEPRILSRDGEELAVVLPVHVHRRSRPRQGARVAASERASLRPLTPKEQQQARAAVERAKAVHAQQLARRGGMPFPPSWQLLDELRDQRTRELTQ